MKLLKCMLVLTLILTLGACSSKFRRYYGPEVTRVVVLKGERRMLLYHHQDLLAEHKIDLGFAPSGDKQFEGDGRTPEGRYSIDRRNPESSFHLSLGISYPNETDIEIAREEGLDPGGDIFIHGQAKRFQKRDGDWTAGCISVSNREIEKIYSMVRNGTVIDIYP